METQEGVFKLEWTGQQVGYPTGKVAEGMSWRRF